MAFAFKQSVATGAVTALTNPVTTTATVQGNLVVVNIRIGNTTSTVQTVTDSAGNAYALAVGPIDSSFRMYQYYGVQTTGGTITVTVTFNTSTASRVVVNEYSGNASTNATVFDTAVSSIPASAIFNELAIAPSLLGELVVAATSFTSAITAPASSGGYILDSAGTTIATEYKLASSLTEAVGFRWTTASVTILIAGAYNTPPPSASGLSSIRF